MQSDRNTYEALHKKVAALGSVDRTKHNVLETSIKTDERTEQAMAQTLREALNVEQNALQIRFKKENKTMTNAQREDIQNSMNWVYLKKEAEYQLEIDSILKQLGELKTKQDAKTSIAEKGEFTEAMELLNKTRDELTAEINQARSERIDSKSWGLYSKDWRNLAFFQFLKERKMNQDMSASGWKGVDNRLQLWRQSCVFAKIPLRLWKPSCSNC